MTTKILIVSVFYNRATMVDASVRSLVTQLEPDTHLLLVDDGSTDNTLERLQVWRSDNVTVISHANQGFVRSIRAAIASMPSTYIAIHGSGDLSLPDRFRKQADYLDQHADIGVVGCHSFCQYSVDAAPAYVAAKKFNGDAREYLLHGNLFHHGEVMMRRSCYEQVGGYRTFFTFAQDRDLFCRLSRVTGFHVIEEVLYTHYVGVPGSVSGTANKVVLQRFLSDFACHCHARRLAGLPDPLTALGPGAALLWQPRRQVLQELFRRAMRALYFRRHGDFDIYRKALLQKGGSWPQRLMLGVGRHAPRLLQLLLDRYYRFKLAGSSPVAPAPNRNSHHANDIDHTVLAGADRRHS